MSQAWQLLHDSGSTPQSDTQYYSQIAALLQDRPAGHLLPQGMNGSISPTDAMPSLTNSDTTSDSSPDSNTNGAQTPEQDILIQPVATKAKGAKRKVADEVTSKARTNAKDRKANASTAHTHEDDDHDGDSSSKKKTSERRKEQNRNAQRAFRERRETHARVLEARIAVLEEEAAARASENSSLKELVDRLQTENTRLNVSDTPFTFNVASKAGKNMSSAPLAPNFIAAANSNAAVTSFPISTSLPASSGISSYGMFGSDSLFMQPGMIAPLTPPDSSNSGGNLTPPLLFDESSELFAPAIDFDPLQNNFTELFTPRGEHMNPMGSINDLFAAASPPAFGQGPEAPLSPSASAALFSAYREPSSAFDGIASSYPMASTADSFITNMAPVASTHNSLKPAALRESSDGEVSLSMESASNIRALQEKLHKLEGADEFDLDQLCRDMFQKATCQESARVAVEKATTEGSNIRQVFAYLGAAQCLETAYSRK